MKNHDCAVQLTFFRQTIDNLDAALMYILSERFRCTSEIGKLKAKYNLPKRDEHREKNQLARLKKIAQEANLDPEFAEKLMLLVINEVVCRHEKTTA
ncbi:chorismate mutase (plasmid) [Pantoea sp. C3]|jgi:chorismate mutase|uniref:chorismate mutase n=1 Tax=Pantoea phytostimulans TaxID=2769024 RepID=UPI002A6E4547|nr:chorismate mutase [Enterobacter sp. CFBP8995]